jgi:hypothetical protein
MLTITGNERPNELATLRRQSGGDPSNPHLLLTKQALARFLARYVAGELNSTDLVEVANQLEMRDEIDYESGAEAVIADVLFEVASPEINGDLARTRCGELVHRLTTVTLDPPP